MVCDPVIRDLGDLDVLIMLFASFNGGNAALSELPYCLAVASSIQ